MTHRVDEPTGAPTNLTDALARLAEVEDTLRAIGAGEIDAFVVANGEPEERVFTLTTADRPYRKFVENMRDGAATLSASGLILYANRRLAELLSSSTETIVGQPLAIFTPSGEPMGIEDISVPAEHGATLECTLRDSHGHDVPVLLGTASLDEGDRLTCLTFADLSAQRAQDDEIARLGRVQVERMRDLQEAQAALTRLATHDTLTGLPNRALLMDRIGQALSHATRSGRRTAVIFIDIDHFKEVNDAQGHAAGDEVLRRVANQLVRVLRPMDTVARVGGDEFVVLAPEVDSHLHAVDISERLATEVRRTPGHHGEVEPIAASVGIAISVAGRGTAESLLNDADTAMFHAKSMGGGRAEIFDAALGLRVHERSMAQRVLQLALDEHRVILYYQPIIDVPRGNVVGFEALARIREHDGTILSPAVFIPVAEETGLVVPLGTDVLGQACAEGSHWPAAAGENALTLAVNLSTHQFESGDLPEMVEETLTRTGLHPTRLHLELTETAIISLDPDVLRQLERIRRLGVEIGLDDFGTGYASLTHLRTLPLTFVKIDLSFVQGLGINQEDERIVAAVVDLAANLGLRSIAEGVETADQFDRLRELGCDQAQGYLFARPLPPAEVPTALDRTPW